MFSKKSAKFIIGFVVIVLIAWVAFDGLPRYQNWQKWRNIKKQAAEFEKKESELQALIETDTYGGKTPRETLEMFISAVEAGNYELASKYFVVEKQGEELESLQNAPKENIQNILDILKRLETVNLRAGLSKMYDEENKNYHFSETKEEYINRLYEVWNYDKKAIMKTKIDGYDFSIDFTKYPSNIWKINEI